MTTYLFSTKQAMILSSNLPCTLNDASFALRPFRRHELISPLRSTLILAISSSTDHDQLPRRIFCETKTGPSLSLSRL